MITTSAPPPPFPIPMIVPALPLPAYYGPRPAVDIASPESENMASQITCCTKFISVGHRTKVQTADYNSPKEIKKPPLVFTVLYHVLTLGIVQMYYNKLAYRAPRPVRPRAGGSAFNLIGALPTHWRAGGGSPNWAQTRGLIQTSWTAAATLSTLALTVDTAFVQLIASCTDQFFKTVALSALILLLASLACGVLYTGYRDSFAGPERETEWREATASDSPFWMLMALPALFLAWAFVCSILAVLYLSFSATCSGTCQGDACGAAIGKPLLFSRVFLVLVVGSSLGLVCYAMKTVRRPSAQ